MEAWPAIDVQARQARGSLPARAVDTLHAMPWLWRRREDGHHPFPKPGQWQGEQGVKRRACIIILHLVTATATTKRVILCGFKQSGMKSLQYYTAAVICPSVS